MYSPPFVRRRFEWFHVLFGHYPLCASRGFRDNASALCRRSDRDNWHFGSGINRVQSEPGAAKILIVSRFGWTYFSPLSDASPKRGRPPGVHTGWSLCGRNAGGQGELRRARPHRAYKNARSAKNERKPHGTFKKKKNGQAFSRWRRSRVL